MAEPKESPTIASLEQTITMLKAITPKNKQIKADIASSKKALANLYATAKNATLVYEKGNHDHLMFVQSTKNFYKLFHHSALFYRDGIAEKIGKVARILPDDDFCDRSAIGYCAIRDMEKIAKNLEQLNIKKDDRLSTNEILAFKLPWNYDDKTIKKLTDNNEMFLGLFEKSVLTQNLFPTLFTQIIELSRAVYENTRTLKDPLLKSVIGGTMLKSAFKIEHIYLTMTNTSANAAEYLVAIQKEVISLKYQAKIIADLNVWQSVVCARLITLMNKVAVIAKQEEQRVRK